MFAPKWIKRRWSVEYEERGTGTVASPDNGWAVAIYFMQAALGAGHIVGVTAPKSFAVVFAETLLMPWSLLYLVSGFVGVYAVLFLRRVSGTEMQWARPELFASLGLTVANGMYIVSLVAGYSGENFPHITVLFVAAMFFGALFRCSQIVVERVKSAFIAGIAEG